MSLTAIPLQFEKYLQNQISVGNAPDMNEMIFAYLPDLDLEEPIDRSKGLPAVAYWVHQQDIDKVGKLGDNALVYSVVIPGSVAAFTFNAIYLRDKNVPNSCGMVIHKADETKEDGMASTKSLMQQYTGAAQIAGINVDADTWQIDYQARLFGIEDDMRLANLDNYGHTAFVAGFDVTQQADPTKYEIAAGVAYIGGLRAVLNAGVIQTVSTLPNGLYVDVVRQGTALSKWENIVTISLSQVELSDYVDGNGEQHYVAKLADLVADGGVTDSRVKGGLDEHEAASNPHPQYLNAEQHLNAPDPHAQYLTRADFIKHMLFKGMPMSAVGPDPDHDIWLPAGRVELLRADYPTVFEIVSASDFFTDQAIIDADPRAYAGHWGTGDGATTFTTDDWALMMNIKVAGGYGAAGSTKEDHIQNITGSISDSFVVATNYTEDGALYVTDASVFAYALPSGTTFDPSVGISFDASLSARTDTYTDTMGLFLDHYRVIPKGVFSYA